MSETTQAWRDRAEAEVARILRRLPAPLRERVRQVPILYEALPSPELQADGVESDTLGLFVGEPWVEEGSTAAPLPAQIILFLDNLREYAEEDETTFQEEVRVTYLHELGHYLGLDEEELWERGLE